MAKPRAVDLADAQRRLARLAPVMRAAACRTLRRRGLSADDAEDVAQAALLAATEALPTFRGRSDKLFVRWVNGILHHHLASYFRSEGRRRLAHIVPLGETDPTLAEPHHHEMAAETEQHLRWAIDQLSERQRFVIEAYFYRGKSLDAIAKSLRATVGAVGKVKARALAFPTAASRL